MDTSKIITIKTFNSQGEAMIIRSLLESAGIECSLLHDTIQSIFPLQNEMTQIELCVAQEDVLRARQVIEAQFDPKEFAEEVKKSEQSKSRVCKCIRRKK